MEGRSGYLGSSVLCQNVVDYSDRTHEVKFQWNSPSENLIR